MTRAKWGSKAGWQTASAKFSAAERAGLKKMAEDTDTSVDSVLHEAAVLHLIRNGYLEREAK